MLYFKINKKEQLQNCLHAYRISRHDYNMSGHKCVWVQTCVGTNVCGHKRVWAQTCVGTNVCGHKRVWVQTCVGTIVCEHNRVWAQTNVWAQSCLGTIVCGHKRVWAQTCLGTNVCGRKREGLSMYGHKRVVSENMINFLLNLFLNYFEDFVSLHYIRI